MWIVRFLLVCLILIVAYFCSPEVYPILYTHLMGLKMVANIMFFFKNSVKISTQLFRANYL